MREEVDYTEALDAFKTNEYIKLEPWGMDVNHLRLIITGRPNTPYENGKFIFIRNSSSSFKTSNCGFVISAFSFKYTSRRIKPN